MISSSDAFVRPGRLFVTGLVVGLLGMVVLRIPPHDSFWSLSLAPVFLVAAYVILMPMGLAPRVDVARSGTESAALERRVGLLVFAAALAVYIATLRPGPGWWDSGQYILCAHTLGVSNPPGSVLLQLTGRLASLLVAVGAVVTRVNLWSAAVAALAVWVVYVTSLRLLRSFLSDQTPWVGAVASACAALSLAFCESIWDKATFTNPYALSFLWAALLFYVAVRWWQEADQPGAGNWLWVAALLLGLDLSVHRSNILLIPVFGLLTLMRRPRLLLDWRLWMGGAACFALGLSLQLFVMLRSQLDPPHNLSDAGSLRGLWDYLTLSQHGIKTFGTDLLERKGPFWSYQVRDMFLRYLGWNFVGIDTTGVRVSLAGMYGLPALLALVGAVYALIRRLHLGLFLLGAFLLSSFMAVAYLNVPEGFFREMDRHYMFSYLLATLWVGVGAGAVLAFAASLAQPRSRRLPAAVTALLVLALPLNALVANWASRDHSDNFTCVGFAHNMLGSLEPGALLFTAGDNDTFPLWYLQTVEGLRPDVTVVNLPLLNAAWHLRHRLRHNPDLPWTLTEGSIDTLHAGPWSVDTLLLTGPGGDSLPLVVESSYSSGYQFVQDQILLDIVRTNGWRRPVYFSMGFGTGLPVGLSRYARFEGLVHRVLPDTAVLADRTPLVENVTANYTYLGWDGDFVDRAAESMRRNYLMAFAYLKAQYAESGETAEAARVAELRAKCFPERP